MSEELELNREGHLSRMHSKNMTDHPHCSDPDHWGCSDCSDFDQEGEEYEADQN